MCPRLLVVDDYDMNRDALSRRLRRCGYEVDEAEGGRRALEMIKQHRFDLVLLDVMMPEVDGFQVLKEVRSAYSATQLPVIMVTAQDASAEVVAAFRLGANDHISKPIDFDVTLARIEALLARHQPAAVVALPDPAETLAPRLPDGMPAWAAVGEVVPNGTVLGSYTILGVLGRGGMGVVYEAENMLLGRRAALKLLHPQACSIDTAAEQRFRSEARAAARIEHPNVVGVYDVGKWDNRMYIAMQLVRGRSGQKLINEQGALPYGEATRIIVDALRGLRAAHEKGVVHRDLKPDNLMICEDGTVKLTDFGLAKMAGAAPGTEALTQTGVLMGTPNYMSPEQVRSKPADVRSDIYSMGCTYYALLTGQHPYSHLELWFDVLTAHCTEPEPDPCKKLEDIPPICGDIVRKATAKSAEARYQTADEMLAALDAVR
jgi:CheY-like chemotaxis protein